MKSPMMRIIRTLLIAPLFLLHLYSQAATVCVKPGTDLQTALNAAVSNQANDEIRISKGTFSGQPLSGFAYGFSLQGNYALTISGGWNKDDNCTTHSSNPPNPADTILTVTNNRGILNIEVGGTSISTLTISNLTFSGGYQPLNAVGASALDITIKNDAAPTIVLNRLIVKGNTSDNSSSNRGSAIFIWGFGNSAPIVQLSNSLISSNTMKDDSAIAAISSENSAAKFYITNNTIINNSDTGASGGGLTARSNSTVADYFYLFNNVVWGNTAAGAASDINSLIPAFAWSYNRNNHIGSLGSNFTFSSNQTTGDPKWTINAVGIPIPNPGSPLINSGTTPLIATSLDLLGAARLQDSTIDRGAIETAPIVVPPPDPNDIVFQDGFEIKP